MMKSSVNNDIEQINIKAIVASSSRNEKMSWKRKLDNMTKLILKLDPIEQKIIKIIDEEKNPILDEIHRLRHIMVNECIHPKEYIVSKDGIYVCKFCERKIQVNASQNANEK